MTLPVAIFPLIHLVMKCLQLEPIILPARLQEAQGASTTNEAVKAGAPAGGVTPNTAAVTGSNGLKSRTLHLKIDAPQISGKMRAYA